MEFFPSSKMMMKCPKSERNGAWVAVPPPIRSYAYAKPLSLSVKLALTPPCMFSAEQYYCIVVSTTCNVVSHTLHRNDRAIRCKNVSKCIGLLTIKLTRPIVDKLCL